MTSMERFARLPGNCPVTWVVVAANALTFVVIFIGGGQVWRPLIFHTAALTAAPWTVLTYPLVGGGGILWVLLGGYMLWLFGGSLERGWGARDYIAFLLLVSAATALGLWVGAILIGRDAVLAGLTMPLAAAAVAWSTINPRERLLLYFALPIEARWLGLGTLVLVVFSFSFPLGVFALAGSACAWWYVRRGRYAMLRPARARPTGARAVREHPGSPTLNPLALYRRWRLRRQFMRLMRSPSTKDDTHRSGPH